MNSKGHRAAPVKKLEIFYGKALTASKWADQWKMGAVPGRWPYGLDTLSEHGFKVSLPSKADADAIAFGFDEGVVLDVARTRGAKVCGTIWIADQLLDPRPSLRTRARRFVKGRALRRMNHLLTFSSATPEILSRELRFPASKISYVPLGVDTDFYTPSTTPASRLVLSVGNDRARDLRTLYGAFELLHQRDKTVEMLVQTSDPRPAPEGVTVVRRFRDHRELRDNYHRAAVIAIASTPNLYTSGSTVALEAQAVGRPVVITNTPGMTDYVKENESGFLVPPEDAEQLAHSIEGLLNDPTRASEMGANGMKRVRADNSTAIMVKRIALVLGSLSDG